MGISMGQPHHKIIFFFQLTLLLWAAGAPAQTDQTQPDQTGTNQIRADQTGTQREAPYRIGPGDVLDISVWKNPDLTKQTVVLPDGSIHFPLVKEIRAQGLSVKELEALIVAKLTKYVPNPVLTISIVQVNTMVLYVTGKVYKPGRFVMHQPIDVLQALSLAGGLNPFAKEKEIGIFRKNKGETNIYTFNYKAVSKGEDLEQNIMLEPGDVIVVR